MAAAKSKKYRTVASSVSGDFTRRLFSDYFGVHLECVKSEREGESGRTGHLDEPRMILFEILELNRFPV